MLLHLLNEENKLQLEVQQHHTLRASKYLKYLNNEYCTQTILQSVTNEIYPV